jgi:hypothetical protein
LGRSVQEIYGGEMTKDKLLLTEILGLEPYTEITGEWVTGYNACLTIIQEMIDRGIDNEG